MVNQLALVTSELFEGNQADFYTDSETYFMTTKQLSKCLGYASKTAFDSLLSRNKYLNDAEFSTTCVLQAVEGNRTVTREMRLFSEDGVYEIAFLSKTAIAQMFRAWVRKILKDLRAQTKQSTQLLPSNHPLLDQSVYHIQQSQQSLTNYVMEHGYQLQSIEDRLTHLEFQKNLTLPSATPLIHHLIEKRQDTSPHGCVTYREVYKRMMNKKAWKRHINKHKRKHGVLRASKSDVIANDTKILELFNKAVQDMLDEIL